MSEKFIIFQDREEAGEKLAEKLKKYQKKKVIVLAIPNGGVPVGYKIAKKLNFPLELMIVRKIQLPWDTEAGFGACSINGCIVLNQKMINYLGLTSNEIENQKKKTLKEIACRNKKYRQNKPFPSVKDKIVILVDDGLATGYTMIVGCRFLKKRKPKKIIVAVPCTSKEAFTRIQNEADEVVSLNIKESYPFAVADFYRNWYDVEDEEVIKILRKIKK